MLYGSGKRRRIKKLRGLISQVDYKPPKLSQVAFFNAVVTGRKGADGDLEILPLHLLQLLRSWRTSPHLRDIQSG